VEGVWLLNLFVPFLGGEKQVSLLFSVELGFKDIEGEKIKEICPLLGQSFCSSLTEPITMDKTCNPVLEV